MTEALLIILIIVVLINIWLSFKAYNRSDAKISSELTGSIDNLSKDIEKNFGRLEGAIKDEFSRFRTEFNQSASDSRKEINEAIKNFAFTISNTMTGVANLQKNQLDTFSNQLTTLTRMNEEKLGQLGKIVEERLKSLQDENSKKLEEMRATVDEKLHKTLEERLGQSFQLVSKRLEEVHRGLGEMQSLASGVSDLKKVLSNVKTRGVLGEIQLENILEQILTSEQYAKNVVTKTGTKEHVEFAIKLPGKDDTGQVVWLPLDSKFPLEVYHHLIEAYEIGNIPAIENTTKLLENTIKKCAKDIREKYIDPPNTTEFGIMFLPIEGLYAEVVRRAELIEVLQRDYRIIITGPTTLAALLNSLQLGFRTLAIERRSSEVWNILGAVKTEFETFGKVLKNAQEKINKASEDIDKLVGVRTRAIQRKLKEVHELPVQEATLLISESTSTQDVEDIE